MNNWDEFDHKYWRQEDNWRFEFYPLSGQVVCFTDGSLLKTIHHFGTCLLDVDWNSFKGRSFYIKVPEGISERQLIQRLSRAVKDLLSEGKLRSKMVLSENINNATGKPLDIFQIRKYVSGLKKDVREKRKNRQQICDFFNQYNIEDDDERKRLSVDIMRVLKSKPSSTMIEEGKKALERLYKQGRLIKLTREEYKQKMEKYGK